VPKLERFHLEDFFCQYEHRPDLINLASSDALPWRIEELVARFPRMATAINTADCRYPNVFDTVLPELLSYYKAPRDVAFLPTSGAAEAIYLSLQAMHCLLPTTAVVGIPKPAYGAFEGISLLLDRPVEHYFYREEQNWQLRTDELTQLAQRCHLLIVNNPHNPTGSVIDSRLLRETADVLAERGGMLIVDEVFRLPDDLDSALGTADNVLVIGSLSKVYGFPGLRFGWVAGPQDIIDRMRTLQQYVTLSISCFAATLGPMLLSNHQAISRHDLLVTNRRVVEEWASANSGLLKTTPTVCGTTVVLQVVTQSESSDLTFERLLADKVLVVPGRRCFDYGYSTWFRLGYGTETDKLIQGLDRIATVLRRT
jgi:aspartate/methionine/tyrosine aminotransferase